MLPKKSINSVEDLLKIWDDINFHTGERYLDSKEVAESDGVYNSYGVYRSLKQFGSQYIVFGYNNQNSKYLVASKDNNASTNSIRVDQCTYVSGSYEIIWSAKVSRSMFINNCVDLFECMFCTQIRSKKYCIANMQFEKDEYMKVKEMVVKWIVDELKNKAKKL